MLNSSISPIKLHTQKTAGFINETSNTAADIYQDVSVKKLAVISKYNLIQLEFEVFNIPQMKKNKVFFKKCDIHGRRGAELKSYIYQLKLNKQLLRSS